MLKQGNPKTHKSIGDMPSIFKGSEFYQEVLKAAKAGNHKEIAEMLITSGFNNLDVCSVGEEGDEIVIETRFWGLSPREEIISNNHDFLKSNGFGHVWYTAEICLFHFTLKK